VDDVNLEIDKLQINVLNDYRTVEVKLHLVIDNQADSPLNETDIIIPWDQTTHNIPLIFDVSVDRPGRTVKTSLEEYVISSGNFFAEPVLYNREGVTHKSIGTSFIPRQKTRFLHGFGTIIQIHWNKPFIKGTTEDFTLSFKLDNVLYSNPNKWAQYIDNFVKSSPINYYPSGGTSRLKLPIIFPFAKNIDLLETYVTLPYGYSAQVYSAPDYTIKVLNKTLTPRLTTGFVLWRPSFEFDQKTGCEKIVTNLWSYDPENLNKPSIKLAEGCILKFPYPIYTEEFLNESEKWYFSPENLAVRNELHLSKFLFNPSLHPTFTDTPGVFLILVDYDLNWWVYFIPLLIIASILAISSMDFDPNQQLTKIAFLMPFIIALFANWSSVYNLSPPLHPNLLDVLFLLTLYVATSQIMGLFERKFTKGLYSSFYSFPVLSA
jgi:hypothetical protein